MKEETDRELKVIDVLTNSVVELAAAVRTQNAILMVLLHNTELKMPEWKELKDIEEEIGPKVEKCVELVRSLDGHDKANKS